MPFYRKRFSRKYARRTPYSKKSVARKARAVAARPSIRNKAIKMMVKREIGRDVETKTKEGLVLDQTIFPSSDTSNFDVYNSFEVGPGVTQLQVLQGTGNGSRVGNRIKIKKLTFKGTIVPLPYNATTNTNPAPIQVKMWIFYDRSEPTTVPQPRLDFFQFNSTSQAFSNDLTDMWAPINTDKYRVLATKQFKLGYSYFEGSGASPAYGNFGNNDFKLNANFSMDLTKYIPKIVVYNDNNARPTSRSLYCVVAYASANGGAVSSTQRLAGMQYWLQMQYEDA